MGEERVQYMEQNDYRSAIGSALLGIGLGILLLLAGAWGALRMANPDGAIRVIAYVALIAGASLCGFLQGRAGAQLPMLSLSAGIYGILLLSVSLIWGGFHRWWMRLAVYLLMTLIAVLVGWVTPSHRPRRKYRYK